MNQRIMRLWPGVMLSVVVALAAHFISSVHGGPVLLYALLLGASLHFLHNDERINPGVDLCATFALRLGVALLGVRISLGELTALGWPVAAGVALCVLSTLALGVLLARCLGMKSSQGVLTGGATAICGASAALAISAVQRKGKDHDAFTLTVIVMVTAFSTLAMVLYPLVVHLLGLTPTQAGLFIGGSIHDVAQVVGAGYTLGVQTGDLAVLVKLYRVLLLLPLVVLVAVLSQPAGADQASVRASTHVPWFLWAFVCCILAQSAGVFPLWLQTGLGNVSRECMVLAIAALGVKTSFQMLTQAGWRPLLLLGIETVWLGALLLTLTQLLPSFQR